MRRLALFLTLVMSLHAAGSVQQSFQQLGTSNNFVLAANWAGDSVTGSVPATLANVNNQVQGYRIFAVEVAPGSPAPTNNYSITLTTPAGVDMLAGAGASLSNVNASSLQTPSFAPPVNGTVTINVTGNSVGGAQGRILIYFAQIAQIHGLIPNGPGFPTNNTFTGTNAFTGPITTANFNNVRVVDGVKFAQTAAGINAADADLGAFNTGQIWVISPGFIATDAQISISADHTLVIMGKLNFEASAGKGPILLAKGAGILCLGTGADQANLVEVTASATIASMVRLATQDGSQFANFVQGCNIFANNATVTNGVIDASGFTSRGWIKDNEIQSFASGWGIFAQDIQSGALAGTNNLQIMNNQIVASGTGGCIEILHSATNAVTMNSFNVQDMNCTGGSSLTTAPIVLQNTDATPAHLDQVNLANIRTSGNPAGQPGITLNGVQGVRAQNISCLAGNNCINITSSINNANMVIDEVTQYAGTNTITDALQVITLAGPYLLHYEVPIANATFSYFPGVTYLKVLGPGPSSATGTGFGTGPAFAFGNGSTNNAGVVQVTAGTTPSSSGTFTVNFNTGQTNFGANPPACVLILGNNGGSWNARATVFLTGTISNTGFTAAWDNNAVNLTASQTYNFDYWCAAK